MQFLPLVSTILLTLLLSLNTILAITNKTMNSEKPSSAEVSGDDTGSFDIVLYSSEDKAEDLNLTCDDNPCDQVSVIKSTSLDHEYFLAGGSQGMTISGASVDLKVLAVMATAMATALMGTKKKEKKQAVPVSLYSYLSWKEGTRYEIPIHSELGVAYRNLTTKA